MPYMPFMNTPSKLAVENRVGETEEDMKKRVHKEVQRSFRKKKIDKILSWIRWRTIYLPRRISNRLWALKRYKKGSNLSLQEWEDLQYYDKEAERIRNERSSSDGTSTKR